MKYLYRVPVLMCKDNMKKSYLGKFDYSLILNNKKEFINKTIDIYVLEKTGRFIFNLHRAFDNKNGKLGYSLEVKNSVKIGEFTITDIKYVSNTVLMVEGVVDSEYRIGEDELERYILRLGGLVGLVKGKYEFFKIMFFYVADVIGDYKKLMSIGTNVLTNEVNNYEFVDIETLVKIKNKREGDIPTL